MIITGFSPWSVAAQEVLYSSESTDNVATQVALQVYINHHHLTLPAQIKNMTFKNISKQEIRMCYPIDLLWAKDTDIHTEHHQ